MYAIGTDAKGLCAGRPEPAEGWIKEQRNFESIKKLGKTDWWGVMPLNGGFVLVPSPLLTYLRDATYEDFMQAADQANAAGRETLIKIFPDYVNRLIAERSASAE